jgi:methylase of polypeptide subunit release factors
LFVLRRGDYAYDAPWSVICMAGRIIPCRQDIVAPLYFVFFLANTSSFLYTTRRGKFLEWDRILDRLHLRGDEGVLDMGCGRGSVLTAVARRLTTGRVTGVDIWSKKDC